MSRRCEVAAVDEIRRRSRGEPPRTVESGSPSSLDRFVQEHGTALLQACNLRLAGRGSNPARTDNGVVGSKEDFDRVSGLANCIEDLAVLCGTFSGTSDLLVRRGTVWQPYAVRLAAVAPVESLASALLTATALERLGLPVGENVVLQPSLRQHRSISRGAYSQLVSEWWREGERLLAHAIGDGKSQVLTRCGTCVACLEHDDLAHVSSPPFDYFNHHRPPVSPLQAEDLVLLKISPEPLLPGSLSGTLISLSRWDGSEWLQLGSWDAGGPRLDGIAVDSVLRAVLAHLEEWPRAQVFHDDERTLQYLWQNALAEGSLGELDALLTPHFRNIEELRLDSMIQRGAPPHRLPVARISPQQRELAWSRSLQLVGKEMGGQIANMSEHLLAGCIRSWCRGVAELVDSYGAFGEYVPPPPGQRHRLASFMESPASILRDTAGQLTDLAEAAEVTGADAEHQAAAYRFLASAMAYEEREDFAEASLARHLERGASPWALLEYAGVAILTTRAEIVASVDARDMGIEFSARVHAKAGAGPSLGLMTGFHHGVRGVATFTDVAVEHIERISPSELLVRGTVSNGDALASLHALIPRVSEVSSGLLAAAVQSVAEDVARDKAFPQTAVAALLTRRPVRMMSGNKLPRTSYRTMDLLTVLENLNGSYVAVQGPPGTGKTHLATDAVRHLVLEGWKVGVVAQSHATVEHFLKMAIVGGVPASRVAKKKSNRRKAGPWNTLWDRDSIERFFCDTESGFLFGGTAWTFSGWQHEMLDLLIVEEAGQFPLARVIAAGASARNLLLIGDPQQLSSVTIGHHADDAHVSALAWLCRGAEVLPETYGYFLGESFRLHPNVCRVVSRLSYDGQLSSHDTASGRRLRGQGPGVIEECVESVADEAYSHTEAKAVAAKIFKLMSLKWLDPKKSENYYGLSEKDFLVVAPHNATVRVLHQVLAAANLARVRVGTVDKFQGQEAPVVIFAIGQETLTDGSASFVLDRRRINVAISRAQGLAVIVRSERLFSKTPATFQDLEVLTRYTDAVTGASEEG